MNDSYAREIPKEWDDIAKMFIAMGDPHRQRILLMFEKDEALNVTEISNASTLSRPAVSHHLKILLDAKVLKMVKRGKESFYSMNIDNIKFNFKNVMDYIDKIS